MIRPLAGLAIFILFVGMACSMGGGETPAPTTPPEPPPTREASPTQEPTQETGPEPTQAPEVPSGAVTTRTDVESSVIRIVAHGDYVYPEGESGAIYDMIGSGTGFIIDPSGIAVTNNHVVSGANYLEVFFSQDDKAYDAKLLGVSECSDLALIDIEGDGFPFLQWYEGPIDVGMEVWSAGYPLGDPEYSLHRGVVSKRNAGGDSDWASVGSVLEHDATINPGNSGGPLINEEGLVVAVNYATSTEAVNQFFAITKSEADEVLDEMIQGNDVNSIGINGTAFISEDGTFSGIWVYSVETSSPAYKAGIRGGDILTQLEGNLMGADGTLGEYCKILRGRNATDPMSVEVLRYATFEMLSGELNGSELEVTGYWDSGSGTTDGGNTTATSVFDDFTEDFGYWEIFDGAEIFNGIFYIGEFADCADVGSDEPFACFSQCLTCGLASEYDMQVDAAYSDGVTDRTFGMVLRFVDYDGDGVVDRDDYYLDFELSIWDKYFIVWEHNTDGKWYVITDEFMDAIRPGRKVNTMRAIASNGGSDVDIYINDEWVSGVTNIPYTEGTVGLVVGGRAVQAAFDNFYFTLP
jgi:S1-C subfamily serine protease